MKQFFDNPKGSSSRTDPDYVDRVDARNLAYYQALRVDAQKRGFLASLPSEERKALNLKIAFLQKAKEATPTELTSKRDPKLLSVEVSELNRELYAYLSRHPEMLHSMSPRRFEELVADILKRMGCAVELTPQTRDGGRDILATFDSPVGSLLTIVECKRYRPDRKIGIDLIERFLFVLDRKDKASCGLFVTTSFFSQEAQALGREWDYRLKLRDLDGVKKWVAQYGTWTEESDSGLWLPRI